MDAQQRKDHRLIRSARPWQSNNSARVDCVCWVFCFLCHVTMFKVNVLTTTSYRSRNDDFMHFVTTITLEQQRERERTRICDWLSKYDFEARHLDLRSLRLPGTFDWFGECDLYREWRTGTMRLLWLEGRSKY